MRVPYTPRHDTQGNRAQQAIDLQRASALLLTQLERGSRDAAVLAAVLLSGPLAANLAAA